MSLMSQQKQASCFLICACMRKLQNSTRTAVLPVSVSPVLSCAVVGYQRTIFLCYPACESVPFSRNSRSSCVVYIRSSCCWVRLTFIRHHCAFSPPYLPLFAPFAYQLYVIVDSWMASETDSATPRTTTPCAVRIRDGRAAVTLVIHWIFATAM